MSQIEHSASGHISLGVSCLGWIISRINVGEALKDAGSVVGIVAGIMAIINFYYSIKKNRK